MQEKYPYEKLLEEYPECEKDIKDSFGYQVELLRKGLDGLVSSIAYELRMPLENLIKQVREYYSFRQRLKRFFKMFCRLKIDNEDLSFKNTHLGEWKKEWDKTTNESEGEVCKNENKSK